jgi:FHS family glucose/mannose:H+ symporter-like MFS transporter
MVRTTSQEARHRVDAGGIASTRIVYAAFLGTGIGVALPGAMLPLLLTRWSMTDTQAGELFFLFFVGSASGALLSRGLLSRSIVRGCAITALGVAMLALASRPTAFLAMTVYGLGLGIAMTSISLLQSRRHPADRAAQMARLNLVWALGACLGPSISLRGAIALSPQAMLYTMAAFFLLVCVLASGWVQHVDAEKAATTVPSPSHAIGMALPFMLLVPLATGIESAAGGWLATYSKRSGETLGVTVGAATCFWAGMLISRLLQSHRQVASVSERWLLLLGPCAMTAALLLILCSINGPAMLAGALLFGLGVGPMYPLLLALALRRGEGGNAIFVLAGAGASLLPLLTGLVSGWTGSLRAGLGVPLLGALVMACLGWAQCSFGRRSQIRHEKRFLFFRSRKW